MLGFKLNHVSKEGHCRMETWNKQGNCFCCTIYSVDPELLFFCISSLCRHNEHDGVSNHQPHDWLLNRLFMCTSNKTSKLCLTGLCAWNSPVTGEFPAQRASNAENVSISWRHHVLEISEKELGLAEEKNFIYFIRTPEILRITIPSCLFKTLVTMAELQSSLNQVPIEKSQCECLMMQCYVSSTHLVA